MSDHPEMTQDAPVTKNVPTVAKGKSASGLDRGAENSQGTQDPTSAVASTCTLVAKWQGNAIELPGLPTSTTIGEVKV